MEQVNVAGINAKIVRRNVKNIRLQVSETEGNVCLFVPHKATKGQIREAIIVNLPWLKQSQNKLKNLTATKLTVTEGETHYLGGTAHVLKVVNRNGFTEMMKTGPNVLTLYTPESSTLDTRLKALEYLHRIYLTETIPDLLDMWTETLNTEEVRWTLRKMTSRWGSANPVKRKITFNTELARVKREQLEYVIVHELAHMFISNHGSEFKKFMTKNMPDWKTRETLLNQTRPGRV